MVKEMCTERRLVPEGLPENSVANLHGIVVVRVRLRSTKLMQIDKRKFSCIAANYKNTMYKTMYE